MNRNNNSHKKSPVFNVAISAMFVAIGMVLPFLTGQIQQIGNMLLPMHIPVFLCGFICPWQYALAVGIILPILRSLIFTMPVFYPGAIAMSVELAVYGLVVSLVYRAFKKKNVLAIYVAMISSMILGRIAWGIMQFILLGIKSQGFTLEAFLAGAIINAVPGIILQLVLIPVIISALNDSGVLNYDKKF